MAVPKAGNIDPHHRFHSYCARFPSEVAEAAISKFSGRGDSVLDLFCGSGTTLVAALVMNRRAIGGDIDTLAGLLSTVKCAARPASSYERWRKRVGTKLVAEFCQIERQWKGSARPQPGGQVSVGARVIKLPLFPELNYWFPPQLITALATIAQLAHDCRDSHYRNVALTSLSASIVSKWPNTLSYAMDIDHTRPHRRIQRFRLDQILRAYLTRLDRTIACLGSLYDAYAHAGIAKHISELARIVCPHDAREPIPGVPDESQALVVTSPPYFGAVDYPRAHRMSVCWMNGHSPDDLASRGNHIGLRGAPEMDATCWFADRQDIRKRISARVIADPTTGRKLAGFFSDLGRVLLEAKRVLRPGGNAVFVIGENMVRGERVPSHAILLELAKQIGFEARETKLRDIKQVRRRYPVGPFGFDGPMIHEFVVVMRKPHRKRSHAKRN
jgi:DNA modification methylase